MSKNQGRAINMKQNYNSSYIFRITLVATLGGLLFGYDTAVISGTVDSINQVFVQPQGLGEAAANTLLGFCAVLLAALWGDISAIVLVAAIR